MDDIENLNELDINNSRVVEIIKSVKPDNSKLYYVKLTDAHIPGYPDSLRLRNDRFLNDAVNNRKPFMVSGFIYKNKTFFIVIKGKDFEQYRGRTDQGNTVIIINKKLLDNFVTFNYPIGLEVFLKSKLLGNINIFICDITRFNQNELEGFINNNDDN